jgi:hypothetical protein
MVAMKEEVGKDAAHLKHDTVLAGKFLKHVDMKDEEMETSSLSVPEWAIHELPGVGQHMYKILDVVKPNTVQSLLL